MTIEYDLTPEGRPLDNALSGFKHVKAFIFDVDGVLTDGKLLVTENGEFLRTFHSRDGYALRRAVEEGYPVCIITGGKGGSIENRLKKLGIHTFFTGADDKVTPFERFLEAHGINALDVLYMGDDLNDYLVMQKVGLPTCPADACDDIQGLCRYISPFKGGEGAVRDVIEKVMKLHGTWLNNLSISG